MKKLIFLTLVCLTVIARAQPIRFQAFTTNGAVTVSNIVASMAAEAVPYWSTNSANASVQTTTPEQNVIVGGTLSVGHIVGDIFTVNTNGQVVIGTEPTAGSVVINNATGDPYITLNGDGSASLANGGILLNADGSASLASGNALVGADGGVSLGYDTVGSYSLTVWPANSSSAKSVHIDGSGNDEALVVDGGPSSFSDVTIYGNISGLGPSNLLTGTLDLQQELRVTNSVGTSGQVLTSAGVSKAPYWTTPAALPGYVLTNNESVATVFSNTVSIDAAHTLQVTNNAATNRLGNVTEFGVPGSAGVRIDGPNGNITNTHFLNSTGPSYFGNAQQANISTGGIGTFAALNLSAGNYLQWSGRGIIYSPGDGQFSFRNNAETSFASLKVDATSTLTISNSLAVVNTGTFTNGIILPSGTNKRAGFATLVGGTVTVNNTSVASTDILLLTRKTAGGTIGAGGFNYTLSAATSFTINSEDLAGALSVLDTSVIGWVLIGNP